jgi:hypothetical protein
LFPSNHSQFVAVFVSGTPETAILNAMNSTHISIFLAFGVMPALGGSIYTPDFNGSSGGAPIQTIAEFNSATPGLDGWMQSEANNDDTAPLSWVTELTNYGPGGTIGGLWDVPAGVPSYGSPFWIDRAIGMPMAGSTLSLDFGIASSSSDFPDLNDYSITVANGTGAGLFTLDFTATLDPNQWNVSWTSSSGQNSGGSVVGVLAGNTPTPAAGGAPDYPIYNYTVDFTQNGSDIDVAISITGSNSWSDTFTLTGLGGETISELEIGTSQGTGADWGDNSFVFVPEPGTAMLLLLSGFGLLRRRR